MDEATPAVTTTPPACLGTDWFDPLEEAVRGQVRAFIERLLEDELAAALGRGRYERGMAAKGHRNAMVTASVDWTRRSDRWCWRCRGRGSRMTVPASASGRAHYCRPTGA